MLDFLGIGAQKCGTTWLYEHLSGHPQVRFPGGKEIHFWDWQRHRGVDWWLTLFSETPLDIKQGEITPAYGILDDTTIAAIYAVAPSVQLFYSIRNPIARAWSAALMMLGRAEMTIDEASDTWFLDHFNSQGSRRRGDYIGCLARWLAVFPKERLYLLLFDDICNDPRAVLLGLSNHLGIAPSHFATLDDARLREPVNKSPDHDLRPSLLGPLRDLYAPDIERLERCLGRDLSPWLAGQGV
jgi:hypothetical protein